MKDWTDEERKLFEESRRLKEKARGLVAKRKAHEAQRARWAEEVREMQERARKEATEAEAKRIKDARDARIRNALLKMADIAKANNLAFISPSFGTVQHAFTLIDRGPSGLGGQQVKINTTPTGFQWD